MTNLHKRLLSAVIKIHGTNSDKTKLFIKIIKEAEAGKTHSFEILNMYKFLIQ